MASSSFRMKPLAVAVSAFVGLLSSYQVVAVPSDIVVSTSTTGLTVSSALDSVDVTSTGMLSGTYYGINNSTTIGTITNAGTISGVEGIFSTGTIGSIINTNLIQATSDAAIWGSGSSSTIDAIDNSGTISGPVAVVIQSGAHLGTLTNSGTITGSYYAIGNFGGGGTIDSIVNTGLISGSDYSIYNASGTFGPITNSGVIAGNIYSASGLTFNGGEGTVFGTLTGYDQTSQGSIYLSSGDLVFASGNLLLNDNITMGSGVVSNQAAALQINNTVSIDGDYQQGSDASLLIGVADDAVATGDILTDRGYGRLVVLGTATIDSGSTVSLVKQGTYAFANGQRYVVVQAATEGTEYNASDLNYLASGYSGVITGSAQIDSVDSTLTDLVVTLGTTGPNKYATTGTAISSMDGLFNYGGTNTSLLNVFNASAALGSSAEANRAGAQLSPAAITSASAQASGAPTNAVLNVISQRADVTRASGSGIATGEGDSDIVVWGQGFGGTANQGQRNEISGYDARFGGLLIGADGAVSDRVRLGGLGSYAATAVDNTGDNEGSSVRIKSYGVFGYASYDGRPWFLNLSSGVVRHQYDTTRQIDFSGFSGDATGAFNGMQYIVSGQAGYPFKLGATDTTLTPIAGLTYSLLKQQGYTEAGGNGAGLKVDDATSTSLKSDLAVKLERRIALSGGEVIPFVQLGWRHEFHDDALQSAASFTADSTGSTDFVTTGSRPVADSGVLSVGTTLVSKRNLSLTLKYTGEAARSYESHSGNLQLRWQF